MDLLSVHTVPQARGKLFGLVQPLFTQTETLASPDTLNRILAADLIAQDNIPAFTRSTVDGYAVRAADTSGAGESIPTVLELAGKVDMGADASSFEGLGEGIASGQCASVPTGGMMPTGADAMVMVEHTELFGADRVGIYSPVATGNNVVQAGDDISLGTVVCAAGSRIGAAEIGVAAALGNEQLEVYVKPRIFIISTGDELVDPGNTPLLGQVRDINSWALAAQAKAAGFELAGSSVVIDDEDALRSAVEQAMKDAEVVVVSGGSSQGEKDATAKIIDAVASTGVITHGLAVKPGKPTITGFDRVSNTLLVGLPGHPLSAMMVFELLLSWLMRETQGTPHPLPVPAVLAQNLASAAGKDTLQLVSLSPEGGTAAPSKERADSAAGSSPADSSYATQVSTKTGRLVATPVFTKSGLISKLVEASGYLWIDRNTEGLAAGSAVAVHLLRPL